MSNAPIRPLTRSSAVSDIVRCAIRKAGITAPSNGANLLRHSAATAMLRGGATLDTVGAVLRHCLPDMRALCQSRRDDAAADRAALAGRCVMLSKYLAKYVDQQQSLGFKFRLQQILLRGYLGFAENCGDRHIRSARVLAWAARAPSPEQRRGQSCTCLWLAAMAACKIRYNRASLKAFRDNLGLQIIRPVLSTYASIHFDTRRTVVLCRPNGTSIVSTLAEDNSSNGAPKTAHKQSEGPQRHAYGCAFRGIVSTDFRAS